ncbi:MAG: hypothetical protein AAGA48_23850 [Myxococcota bacterium]
MPLRVHGFALVGAIGCAPPDAESPPPSVDEAIRTVFSQFQDDDPSELVDAVRRTLVPMIDDKIARVEQPDDDLDPGWYLELPPLPTSSLGDLQMPEGVSADDQSVPTSRVNRSAFTVADFRRVAANEDGTCLEAATTKWARRSFASDPSCFAEGFCDELTGVQATLKDNPLLKIWYDQRLEHRVIDIGDDETGPIDALITRGSNDQRWFSQNGNKSWDQLWTLQIVADTDEGAVRFSALWASLQVALLSDALLEQSVRGGLAQEANWRDHFLETGEAHPNCNHDRGAEMPDRW